MTQKILRWMTWEDIRDITTAVYETPPGNATNAEQYFRNILNHLRDEKNMLRPIDERFPSVLKAAEQSTSWMLTDTRERENFLIRCFVSYKLHNEGYSYSEIGKMMRRDHSTVTHLVYRMRDMLSVPGAYKWELQQFKRFEELCKKQD